MKNVRLVFLVIVMFMLNCVEMANGQEAVEKLAIGNGELVALTDTVGKAHAAVFPEIKKFPECEKLFAAGPLPSRTRVFYFDKGDKKILIDSGWGTEQKEGTGVLLDLLRKIHVDPASITDILLTHMDFDHLGDLVRERRAIFPNATLWISRPEHKAWGVGKIRKRPVGKLEFANYSINMYKDKIRLFDFGDEILPGVTALDSSGHTPGHTAYEIKDGRNRIIIAGDSIISEA